MKILITNDDGWNARGLAELVAMMRPFGDILVVAPKYHQSGTSMAVSMGYRQIAVKKIVEKEHEVWYYLDGTPASCVKFGLDNILEGKDRPDIIVSGINHGNNSATATLYSATVGAAMEGAVNSIPSLAVSIDDFSPEADFACVREYFPALFEKMARLASRSYGKFYNINFPAIPAAMVKGIRVTHQGNVHWEDEYQPFDPEIYVRKGISPRDMGILFTPEVEEGESLYMMAGECIINPGNTPGNDIETLRQGYITITCGTIDTTDFPESRRLRAEGIELDF